MGIDVVCVFPSAPPMSKNASQSVKTSPSKAASRHTKQFQTPGPGPKCIPGCETRSMKNNGKDEFSALHESMAT